MIKVIKLFIIILILSSVVVWLSDNPGKVEIVLNNYLIQTNMIGISLLLVSIVFLAIIIFVIFGTIKNFPKNFKLNRKAKYLKLANESLDNLAENILLGNSDNIEKDARKLRKYLDNDLFSVFILFNSCLIRNDFKGAQKYLNILQNIPRAKYIYNKASVILLYKSKKIDDTKKMLLQLCEDKPEDIWFHEKLSKLYAVEKDWKRAYDYINKLRSLPDFLRDYAAQLKVLSGGKPLEALNLSNNSIMVVNETIKYLLNQSNIKKAAEVINESWDKLLHLDLIKTFMSWKISGEKDILARYKLISKILKKKVNKDLSNETKLALAYASSAASIWGESQNYLDKINREDWDERMIEVFKSVSKEIKGTKILEPEKLLKDGPKWTCRVCRYNDSSWYLICPNCKSINTISWPKSKIKEQTSPEFLNELLKNPLRHLPKMKSEN